MKFITIILALFFSLPCFSQVAFENLTLPEALVKASQSGKMVFVQFVDERCSVCSNMADSSFKEASLGKLVAQKFVAIKIDYNNASREDFMEDYNKSGGPGTFFFSAQGDLVHAFRSTSPTDSVYTREIKKAVDKQTEGAATFAELNREWNDNSSNFYAMERNLEKRQEVGLKTDSLLEVYIKRLPGDSLKSVRVIKKIMLLSPDLFSRSYSTMRRDTAVYHEAWRQLESRQRSEIISRTVRKSMAKAIAKKSVPMALMTAVYSAGKITKDKNNEGASRLSYQMLGYFMGVRDTAEFLSKSKDYLAKFIMPSSKADMKADSLKRADFYACMLYKTARMAYYYRNYGQYENDAIKWIEKSISLIENHYNLNIYAMLLYRAGNHDQAIALETKAAAFVKDNRYFSGEYGRRLIKMKQGADSID